jgi:hypothetical protein
VPAAAARPRVTFVLAAEHNVEPPAPAIHAERLWDGLAEARTISETAKNEPVPPA